MKIKALIIITFLILLTSILSAVEIIYEGKIQLTQKEGFYIGASRGFVVTNEGLIIVCDSQASDFKIFNSQGQPMGVFGRRGYGPDEFASPWLHDYQNGKLIISDTSTQKLYIYQVGENAKFKLQNQLMAANVMDAKLVEEKNMVLISCLIPPTHSSASAYILFTIDLNNGTRNNLISLEEELGKNKKKGDFNKLGQADRLDYPGWFFLPQYKFCDYSGDDVYSAWTSDLDIIKVNLLTGQHSRFFQRTKNYSKPKASKELKKAYLEMNITEYRKYRQKMSWVSKILADSEVVGVIYSNFDSEISRWESFLQIYDHQGNFLKETPLENFSSTYEWPDYYYDQASRILYCLSESSIGAEGLYTVYKYRLH